MKHKLKKAKRNQRINKVIRFSEEEFNAANNKAMLYGANFSEWVRYAAQNCMPRKQDLEKKK